MAQVGVNGINLEYEWHGDRSNPPVVAIAGFTNQLICWPETFVDGILDAGYSFVVFDSREMGLSTRFDDLGPPNVPAILAGTSDYRLPYTLDDMARDTIGLMDALQIDKAHVMGFSTGGYKALLAALEAPDRIKTVTTLMSSTYNPELPLGNHNAISACIDLCFPVKDRTDCIDRVSELVDLYNGRCYGFTPDEQRAKIGARYDRGWYTDGIARHALAVATREPRNEEFANITQPILVVHGTDDCFFSMSHARDLLSQLPQATLDVIEGAGHALSNAVSEAILPAVTRHLGAIRS